MTVHAEIDDEVLKDKILELVAKDSLSDYLPNWDERSEHYHEVRGIVKKLIRKMVEEEFSKNREIYKEVVREVTRDYLEKSASYKAGIINKTIREETD